MTVFAKLVEYNSKNTTDNCESKTMEVKIKERINKKIDNKIFEKAVKCFAYFAGGFLLSLGRIANDMRPLPLALIIVSKDKGYIFSAIGAIAGYLMLGLDAYNTRYIAAALLVCVGSFALDLLNASHSPALCIAISTVISLATGIVLAIKTYAELNAYMLLVGEAILTMGVTYFYFKSLNANFRRLRFKALPISDITCIIISLSTLLLCSSYLSIGVFNPVRAIAIAIILFTIRYSGDRWGIILAGAFGFVFGIYDSRALAVCGAITFSAIVANLFTPLASFGIGLGYFICTAFFAIAEGGKIGLSLFIDSAIGTAIFLLMPYAVCERIEKAFDNSRDMAPDGTLRQNLVLKLRFASSAMSAISDSVDQVRERINEVTRRENQRNRDNMTDEEFIRKEIILEKTNQIRMVASDQFYSISGMLNDLAQEFDEAEIFDSNASAKIRRLLGDYDIYPSNISAIEDKFGRMRVEILVSSNTNGLSNPKLKNEIGKICNRYFETGRITNFKNDTMLAFTERPCYKLDVGFAQHSAEGKLCGDSVKIINDNKGHSILIISDGMGKGSRAALDGAMGAGLLSRLLNAGFGFDSSLKIINSALLVKSNDESLATLDIANIDLFTGKCEIFKAGAPASFIIKGNSLTKCELTSMPAGILRGIEFAKRTAVLSLGDSIILLSDGITDLGEDWLRQAFKQVQNLSPQECAQEILDMAIECSDKRTMDDMSIIYARLERNQ